MKRKAERMPTPVEMVAYIREFIEANGWPPSRREMAAHFGISAERAQAILMQCRDEKLVEVRPDGPRQVKLTPFGKRRITQMKQIEGKETQL